MRAWEMNWTVTGSPTDRYNIYRYICTYSDTNNMGYESNNTFIS